METYTRRLARGRRGVQDSRDRAQDLFLSSLPSVACFALHARLVLAFEFLSEKTPFLQATLQYI